MAAEGQARRDSNYNIYCYSCGMNRSDILRIGMERTETSQSELSRVTGVPQGRISNYVTGKLEPSEGMLDRLLGGLGVQVSVVIEPVQMERTKLRSWRLHRTILQKLSGGEPEWERMDHNLERLRSVIQGQPHERNLDRWQRIVDTRNLREFRRVLTDLSTDGIEMREVSPMSGTLTEEERRQVLLEVPR